MSDKRKKSVIGYMCSTDFWHELGDARGGNVVYGSIEDLKKHRICAETCGVTKVKVSYVKTETPTHYEGCELTDALINHYREHAKLLDEMAKGARNYADKLEKEKKEKEAHD